MQQLARDVLGFLAAKGLAIWLLAGGMRIPLAERPVFTVLLAQGGEFAFVVFQAAAGSRVFAPETASLLIGAVAVSGLMDSADDRRLCELAIAALTADA